MDVRARRSADRRRERWDCWMGRLIEMIDGCTGIFKQVDQWVGK